MEEGGIEAFFHVPDAWINRAKTEIGYEISFTRHFYEPTPLRPLEEIKADLLALQEESKGLLDEIIAPDGREGMTADLRPYPKYRSGLPWLGKVPEHWGIRRAKYLLTEQDQPVE